MAYRIYTLDCAATSVGIRTRIIDIGQVIEEVVILSVPANITIQLAFGDGPLFDVTGPVSFQPRGADDAQRGLYWQNPAVSSAKIQVLVASGGSLGAHPAV